MVCHEETVLVSLLNCANVLSRAGEKERENTKKEHEEYRQKAGANRFIK